MSTSFFAPFLSIYKGLVKIMNVLFDEILIFLNIVLQGSFIKLS